MEEEELSSKKGWKEASLIGKTDVWYMPVEQIKRTRLVALYSEADIHRPMVALVILATTCLGSAATDEQLRLFNVCLEELNIYSGMACQVKDIMHDHGDNPVEMLQQELKELIPWLTTWFRTDSLDVGDAKGICLLATLKNFNESHFDLLWKLSSARSHESFLKSLQAECLSGGTKVKDTDSQSSEDSSDNDGECSFVKEDRVMRTCELAEEYLMHDEVADISDDEGKLYKPQPKVRRIKQVVLEEENDDSPSEEGQHENLEMCRRGRIHV